MKIKLLCLFYILSSFSFAQSIKWEDNMNGNNSIAGLQARGWVIIDNDGGGTTPTWFQPNGLTFTSFEGHDSGYVASNFDGANANGVIDHWLISPQLNVSPGDSLSFYARSPQGSQFPDSIYMLVSLGGQNISDFSQVGDRFEVDTSGWSGFYITFTITSTIRFAINYYIFNGGPEGSSSDYIGLDLFRLYSTSGTTYPSTIQLSKSYTFDDPTKNTSYRLIGLPGNNNLPVTTFITGTHKKDWNVFYDDGSEPINLTEFNGQPLFNFTPGKGFWALSRNPINVSRQVNTVALLADNTVSINLHTGWNIISNPFEKSVSVADIRTANGLAANATFHNFNGSFPTGGATTMAPYEGYYFMNPDGRGSLSIPYPFTSSLPKINEQPYFLSEESLKLKLSSAEFSSEVMIGFDKTASNDYDEMDYFAPPGNFEELGIRLVNNHFSTSYKQLFIEHRPEIGEGQSFELQLKNATNKNANLIINGIEKFAEYEVYLIDERLKKFYNLKIQNEIELSGNHQNNQFSLLIGKLDFIKTYKDNYTPTEFALYQNYPNPFNPTTFIRYQVPEKTNVSIKIYDVLGNLIKVLVDEIKDEGYYEVEFDGSSANGGLSSGIYLYEFESGLTRSIKKMTLLK